MCPVFALGFEKTCRNVKTMSPFLLVFFFLTAYLIIIKSMMETYCRKKMFWFNEEMMY